MPKLRRVNAHQAYMAHPVIQIGYSMIRGGLGTVVAMVILQPIDIAQATTSKQNLNLLLCQSSLIQLIVPLKISNITRPCGWHGR